VEFFRHTYKKVIKYNTDLNFNDENFLLKDYSKILLKLACDRIFNSLKKSKDICVNSLDDACFKNVWFIDDRRLWPCWIYYKSALVINMIGDEWLLDDG